MHKQHGLEMHFKTGPDASGVVNGLDLAREMISDAYKLLAPYVKACAACTDDLFTAIANEEIAKLHAQREEEGRLPDMFLVFSGAEDKDALSAVDALLEKQREQFASPYKHLRQEQDDNEPFLFPEGF
jgi:hypothetical protein